MKKSQAEGHLFWYLFSRPSNSNKSITIEGKYHLTIAHGNDNQLYRIIKRFCSAQSEVLPRRRSPLSAFAHIYNFERPLKSRRSLVFERINLFHTPTRRPRKIEAFGQGRVFQNVRWYCVRWYCPLTVENMHGRMWSTNGNYGFSSSFVMSILWQILTVPADLLDDFDFKRV